MRWIIPVAAIFLAGCQSEGERAEAAYQSLRTSGGSQTELCRSAHEVKDAYQQSGQKDQAEQWARYAQTDCVSALWLDGYRDHRLNY